MYLYSCAQILWSLHDLKRTLKGKTSLLWTADTMAFHAVKDALADASLLVHPRPNNPTCVLMDASSAAVDAVLQQRLGDTRCPLLISCKRSYVPRCNTAPLIASCWLSTWPSSISSTSLRAVTSASTLTTSLSCLPSSSVQTSLP